MTDQERVTFVQDINLKGVARGVSNRGAKGSAPSLPDTGDVGAVVAGSVVSFTANLTGEARQDVLNSTLLAQLSANAEKNAMEDPVGWYMEYTKVLEHLGWNIQGRGFAKHENTSGALQLDKEALGILEAIFSPNKLSALAKTLEALKKASDDSDALTIFSGNATAGQNGVFQLGSAEQSTNGDVSLAFGTFHFTSTTHKGRFLFVTWQDDQIGIEFAAEQATLNQVMYAVVRPHVQAKLAEKMAQFVANISV